MADCLKLIILAGLVLLGLKTRDAFVACANIKLEFLAIYFDLPRLLFKRFDSGNTTCQLRFEIFHLQRQSVYFSLDLLDLLLSILKNEQLFQFGMHAR